MSLSNVKPIPKLDFLVTHPGSIGCGGVLVAHAVQQSRAWNAGGKICLLAEDEDAEKAYLALGFVRSGRADEPHLYLDQVTSDKWDSETLGLKKDAHEKHIA